MQISLEKAGKHPFCRKQKGKNAWAFWVFPWCFPAESVFSQPENNKRACGSFLSSRFPFIEKYTRLAEASQPCSVYKKTRQKLLNLPGLSENVTGNALPPIFDLISLPFFSIIPLSHEAAALSRLPGVMPSRGRDKLEFIRFA